MIERDHNSHSHTEDHEYESDEVMRFAEYRELCDVVTDNFRKVGLQDEESYNVILSDPRTVFITRNGKKIPLLSPIEFEKMFDTERCGEITKRSNVMLLSLPKGVLEKEEGDISILESAIDDDMAVIVEDFVSPSQDLTDPERTIPGLTDDAKFSVVEFRNPNLTETAGHEVAWMAAYRFGIKPKDAPTEPYEGEKLQDEWMEAWRLYCEENDLPQEPTESSSGTFVFSNKQLMASPDVLDELWSISEEGFGKVLGANHPVSMQFNREFFDKQMVADNTLTTVHYVNGEPICFGFLGLDMKNNEWLNLDSSLMGEEMSEAAREKKAYVHFYELIGKGLKGMGYSAKIFSTLFGVLAKTNRDYNVFFESTNLSSTYIPPSIDRQLEKSNTIEKTSDIEMLGKLTYWAIKRKQDDIIEDVDIDKR